MFPELPLRPAIKDSDDIIYSLSFSSDSQIIASGTGDGSVHLYNAASGRRLFRLLSNSNIPAPVTAAVFKPHVNANEPQVLMAAQSSGHISVYNAFRGQLISSFQIVNAEKQPTDVYTIKYCSDGSIFGAAGKDAVVRIYDSASQKMVMAMKEGNEKTCRGHTNRVFSLVFSDSNPNILYTAGWDQTVQIWDMRVGHAVNSLHKARVYGDSLDVKEETLLIGNYDIENQFYLYDIRNPTEPVQLQVISWDDNPANQVVEDFDQQYLQKIKTESANRELLENVEFPDDDEKPEKTLQCQNDLGNTDLPKLQKIDSVDEPTMIYDAKFGKTKDVYFGSGSGGRQTRLYRSAQCVGAWKAPSAVYCAAASQDGRFGAVAGNRFGIQVFSIE